MKKVNFPKVLYFFVLISFIFPIVFLLFKMVLSAFNGTEKYLTSDRTLMLVQCILGVFVIHLPSFLAKRLKFEFPSALVIMYIIFLYCAIFLGEVRSFYFRIPHWDDILHLFSSIMTGMLGFMAVAILNKDQHVSVNLSPFFVCLFAFCFSLTLSTLWELYEFAFDGLLGLNMQKHTLEDGTVLAGRQALFDTMKDFIVDSCGALISTLIGYISIKSQKGWISVLSTDKK